jgi:hypothetical protein
MHIPTVKCDPKGHVDLGPELDGRMRKPAPIENPWLKLPCRGPHILEIDRDSIERYNAAKADPDHKIDTSLIPEPFIGNPRSAKLVLLNLNPGLAKGDAEAHARPDFRTAMLRNLRHESQEYPFYPLNPQFEQTPCAHWWLKKTRRLVEECGRAIVADGLLVIEWFPYHSKKSGLPKVLVCESQLYSCQIAKEMFEKRKCMVLMRSKDHWDVCDERLSELPLPNSRQNPSISPGNFGEDLFKCMKHALCADEGPSAAEAGAI